MPLTAVPMGRPAPNPVVGISIQTSLPTIWPVTALPGVVETNSAGYCWSLAICCLRATARRSAQLGFPEKTGGAFRPPTLHRHKIALLFARQALYRENRSIVHELLLETSHISTRFVGTGPVLARVRFGALTLIVELARGCIGLTDR